MNLWPQGDCFHEEFQASERLPYCAVPPRAQICGTMERFVPLVTSPSSFKKSGPVKSGLTVDEKIILVCPFREKFEPRKPCGSFSNEFESMQMTVTPRLRDHLHVSCASLEWFSSLRLRARNVLAFVSLCLYPCRMGKRNSTTGLFAVDPSTKI
jgi:hypothetical protein